MAGAHKRLAPFVRQLSAANVNLSLFGEPDIEQVDGAVALGAQIVELHTGAYCEASHDTRDRSLIVSLAAAHAEAVGIECHAGHEYLRHGRPSRPFQQSKNSISAIF